MPFSLTKRGTKEDILKAIEADSIPAEVGDLVAKAIESYTDPKAMFSVRIHGNINQAGYNGNSAVSIEVIKTNELHPSFLNKDAAPNKPANVGESGPETVTPKK